MSDKNLVTNPNAVKPIEDTANTENAIEERYLYDLYKNLEKAEQDKDEAAQLKAFKALQNYYISQETTMDKIGVAYESAMQGTNKGISIGIGLPVDIVNIILGMGEKGVRKVMNDVGFEVSPDNQIVSDKPFLGGKQVEEMFNKIGI